MSRPAACGTITANEQQRLSKTLSYILRHNAHKLGITLDEGGYASIPTLLQLPMIAKLTPTPTFEHIEYIVTNCPKQRFAITHRDGIAYIRANQGHSIAINETQLLTPITPENVSQYPLCIHGTYMDAWEKIKLTGLSIMGRTHIHCAAQEFGSSAMVSGMRSNCNILIYIDLVKCITDKIPFWVSTNQVLLTKGIEPYRSLPPTYFREVIHFSNGKRESLDFDCDYDHWLTNIQSLHTTPTTSNPSHPSTCECKSASSAPRQTIADQRKQRREADKARKMAAKEKPKTHPPHQSTSSFSSSSSSTSATQSNPDYLLILDFEATCNSGRSWGPNEIIEFPILMLNTQTYEIEQIFHQYVRPIQNPQLTSFCTEFTGIEQKTVDEAKPFEQVLTDVEQWLLQYQLITNDGTAPAHSFVWVTCGDWDLLTMLPKQCLLSNVHTNYFNSWCNLKHLYSRSSGLQVRGMTDMLSHSGLTLKGRHHSGIDDCHNIGEICKTMLRNGVKFQVTRRLKDKV